MHEWESGMSSGQQRDHHPPKSLISANCHLFEHVVAPAIRSKHHALSDERFV